MIDKIIYADDYLETGEPAVRELSLQPGGEIIKTAFKLPIDILKYTKNISPEVGKSYLLINALGASGILYQGGIWGQNRNGDYFAEADLIAIQSPQEAQRNPGASKGVPLRRYKTFENGYFFSNHTNKDPAGAIGKILFADYDMDMHRILLIVEFWRDKDPILASKLDKGMPISTSMGCRVPGDYCTICNNYSRKPDRSDACVHVKSMVGQVLPDGRRVGMINKSPRFFDISKVYVGADVTSRVLMKVASSGWQQHAIYSYTMPRYYTIPDLFAKKASQSKGAALQKNLPPDGVNGQVLVGFKNLLQAARNQEPTIPNDILDQITLRSDLEKVGAIVGLGFIPHPAELDYLGIDEDQLMHIQPFYHEKTAALLEDYIPYRTIYDPYVSARLLDVNLGRTQFEKTAGFLQGAPGTLSPAALVIAGALYGKIMTALAAHVGTKVPMARHLSNPLLQTGLMLTAVGGYGGVKSLVTTAPRHNTVDSGQIDVPQNFDITKVSRLYSLTERNKYSTKESPELSVESINKVAYILNAEDEDTLIKFILAAKE